VLCFEDLPVGREIDCGSFSLTAEEIVAFARQFDPQPFHVDPDAAAQTSFKGLIASGWHTGSMMMRRYADTVLADADSRGSPGLEELRWRRPVRPGDTIHVTVTVLDAWRSRTVPDRGTVVLGWEGSNDAGEPVITMRGRGMFGVRSPEAADR
jgi:acyl dehydratase